ncbi:MAG: phosphoribosyltransferase [Candidatus Pacebacteria bacterium]|jgi:orotate phosphoribosyltransferase-like protein|nr:phosphoribosyltransferase [Candidatus Paceibacterota bacterium]
MSEKPPQLPDLNALRKRVLEQAESAEPEKEVLMSGIEEQVDMIQALSQQNVPKNEPDQIPDIKTLRRDLLNKKGIPAIPLEQVQAIRDEELKSALEQIEMIKDSLQNLANRIKEERPDLVVFLDLSARIFGTPFLKYLSETMGKEAPPIRFYNDQELKGLYLQGEDADDVIEKDFEQIKGKKVFFVDETFSTGKGAIALQEAANKVDADAYYFALSKDPNTEQGLGVKGLHHDISEKEHFEKVNALVEEGRIVVYDNPIQELFSRFATRLYAQDWQGETLPLHVKSKSESNIPDANSYYAPPEGMSMEEYSSEISKSADMYVRTVKDKVYEALKG